MMRLMQSMCPTAAVQLDIVHDRLGAHHQERRSHGVKIRPRIEFHSSKPVSFVATIERGYL
jgi:hypothetical protein